MTDDCKHGMDPATCSFCRPRPAPHPQPAERTIRARFDGRCPCGQAIYEGERIGLVDGEWLCSRCVET